MNALLDPYFTRRQRRWGTYLEAVLWLAGAALLATLTPAARLVSG